MKRKKRLLRIYFPSNFRRVSTGYCISAIAKHIVILECLEEKKISYQIGRAHV